MNIGPQPRVYPAVYSGVGVYECMIRGIAVMRRRADSYVNATQILKVAGIDKGRRTKILEKEILPGKHEIVQGGYGKYQGTWIPLERGRDVAAQYGVAPLLAPLFDHVPNPAIMGSIPGPSMRGSGPVPPMHFPHMRPPHPYMIHYMPPNMMHGRPGPMFPPHGAPMYSPYPPGPGGQPRLPPMYAPQPMPPGAPHMPMMNHQIPPPGSQPLGTSPQITTQPPASSTGPAHAPHKRNRDEIETEPTLSQDTDMTMVDDDVFSNPRTTGGQPPFKKARTDSGPVNGMDLDVVHPKDSNAAAGTIDPKALSSVLSFPPTTILPVSTEPSKEELEPRASSMPTANRVQVADAIRRSTKRAALYSALQRDEPGIVVPLLLEQGDEPMLAASDIDAIIDSKGHTSLHIASALGSLSVVEALVSRGADVHRGNYRGETPLMRAILTTAHYQSQTFESLLRLLRQSIRTTDEAKRSVLHHIAHVAGVLGRAPEANYYLACILLWIAKHQNNRFDTLIDLRDENEDTALNIASRLGLKTIASTFITFGAKPNSANRFGIQATDYGVISKESNGYSGDSIPTITESVTQAKSSEDVIGEMNQLVQSMSQGIVDEKAAKDVEYQDLQRKLQEKTKLLAEKRKQLEELRLQSEQVDQVNERISNLEAAKGSGNEDFDWTGRASEVEQASGSSVPVAFRRRKDAPAMSISMMEMMEMETKLDGAMGSQSSTLEDLIMLRRIKLWHERMTTLLTKKQASGERLAAEKERQLRRLVALCTGLSTSETDEQVDSLLESIESEPHDPGQIRLAAFMERTKPIMA